MFKKLYSFIFSFFPLFKFKIKGHSMEPTLKEGSAVLVNRLSYLFRKPKIKDVVIIKRGKYYIIKRITKINPSADKDKVFVEGDNKKESTDSRKFGWVYRQEIVGKVIYKISN